MSDPAAILAIDQAADIVRERVREHRHHPIGEIGRIAPQARLGVHRRARRHVMGNVGNGDDQPPAAAALYQKACDLGFAASCNNLGFILARGAGLEKDLAKAVALYQKACDWGTATR